MDIINAVVAVLALGLSGLALYRQRAAPKVEAHPAILVPTGVVRVTIRNGGTASARAPWFFIAAEGQHVIGRGGTFLGPEESAGVTTELKVAEKPTPDNIVGVVGCYDSKGRHLQWSMRTGKRKRKETLTYEEGFRLFYPDLNLGVLRGAGNPD